MPLQIIIGGQFGGEGKGLIAAALADFDKVDILVRPGGPNSSHTIFHKGRKFQVRSVPTGTLLGIKKLVWPAGALIHIDTLFLELKMLGFDGQIMIDPNAGIIQEIHISEQKKDDFYSFAGSTLTGTGFATAERARRRLPVAKEDSRLKPYLCDTRQYMQKALEDGKKILIEGCQSFGLSNYHGEYPFVTSRDSTAAAFLSQCGLPPKAADSVVLVLKCFPTRNMVGKGSLLHEQNQEWLATNLPEVIEFGGGSYGEKGMARRVGLFDYDIAQQAVRANGPQFIALTGLDNLQRSLNIEEIRNHYGSIDDFKSKLESTLKVPIGIESWGPSIENVVDKRARIN